MSVSEELPEDSPQFCGVQVRGSSKLLPLFVWVVWKCKKGFGNMKIA